ncbi:hypothetical protein EBB79_15010 [Parasedimentitalea marina]|uniref:Uncharacterized protein n=1 Tax=Parasedimentitalea marina TaxID=2483033 RepID=A0A3T0N4Z1_9RHOB|nr:hypothetical protein [Parasedimentitalea marina]AZV79051.1 hypothetical protein EBB79_15010 [Parasedimentitalea marina]
MQDFFYAACLLSLVVVCSLASKFLVARVKSEVFWEQTDYFWYSLALIGVLAFSWDFQTSRNQDSVQQAEDSLRRHYNNSTLLLTEFLSKSCTSDSVNTCEFAESYLSAISRFKTSSRYPGGEIEFHGQLFRNPAHLWVDLIGELEEPLATVPLQFASFEATAITDALGEYRALAERRQKFLPPFAYAVLAFFAVVGVTLKFGKVRLKVQKIRKG